MVIDHDKNILDREEYAAQFAAASSQLQEELRETSTEDSMYYPGAVADALKKHRALSKEERDALKRGDDIDEIHTSDLDKVVEDSDDDTINEISFDYLERNRINLARMFYGYDGGYTIRKLKKFIKNERLAEEQEKENEKKYFDKKKAQLRGEEEEEVDAAEVANPEEEAGAYSDESDIDYAIQNMDEEEWEKIVAELEAQRFKTEEEAKTYFDAKLKDVRLRLIQRRPVKDERAEKDPYYAMLKEDKPIASRFSD